MNNITLFSNGVGHFSRSYKVAPGSGTKVSIPFNKIHLGSVAASFQVFGPVKLLCPPSFSPANANNTALVINQGDSLKSLLSRLSGCKVRVPTLGDTVFTLVGLHARETSYGTSVSHEDHMILEAGGELRHASILSSIEFVEDVVKAEVQKALRANFEKIKPDSTFLEVQIGSTAESEVEAIVQYTIPVAAWKMRYAIRQEKGGFVFEGAAIIDNNTDEDWGDFKISVVTGNPVSFDTDLASVVVPERKFMSLVDSQSLGNVAVEEGVRMRAMRKGPSPAPAMAMNSLQQMASGTASFNSGAYKMSVANYADFGLEAAGDDDIGAAMDVAEGPEVESKEVGDFSIFTSKEPITILARKSAVVPMFGVPLSSAGLVLMYKETNHARRPFRAIKFKNETEFSLGKGKTVIYNEGVFSGECVLDVTKPGENRMLPHCLENSVKVFKETKPMQSTEKTVSISKGIMLYESVDTMETTYTIDNKKDESFKFLVEHNSLLGTNVEVQFTGVEIKETEKLSAGYRVYFELPAKTKIVVTAKELRVNVQKIGMYGDFTGFYATYIQKHKSLAEDKVILDCIALQKELKDIETKEGEAQDYKEELEAQVKRVRENLKATKDLAHSVVDGWVKDLDESEKEIRNIDKKELPALRDQRKVVVKKLKTRIQEIATTWTAQ